MIGAYYTKDIDSKEIFDKLEISNVESYLKNLNKYNVISISFNKLSDRGNTYSDYMEMIKTSLIQEERLISPFILEFKKDENVDSAIKQMKEKEYFQKFIKEYETVLLVAICCDSKMKNHSCKIENVYLQ